MRLLLLIILSITTISGVAIVDALTLSPGPEDLFKKSDYVIVGKILSFREIPAKQETEYLVQADEMLKPLPTNGGGFHGNITVVAQGTRHPTGMLPTHEDTKFFDVGDRALLFLDFTQVGKTAFDKGRFDVSLYSFTARGNCTGSQLLQQMYGPSGLSITQNNQSKHLYTNKPVNLTFYVYNRDLVSEKKDFEFAVFTPNGKISEKRQVQLQECKRSAGVNWSFIPTVQGKYTFSAIIGSNEGGSESISGILVEDYVAPPLQQFKAETRDGIQCKLGLELLQKASDGSPACVKPQSKIELLKRGWGSKTWPFKSVIKIDESSAICAQNGGHWLSQYKECEYVSAEKCSLIGGQYEEKSNCRHNSSSEWCAGEGIPVCTINNTPINNTPINNTEHSKLQREITILSITPQNVTLPEPKIQTHKTKCNADGVCFTPE